MWGIVRILLFTSAFAMGLLWHPPSGQDTAPWEWRESAGTSLIITCDTGRVQVLPVLSEKKAVKLACTESRMLVVRQDPLPTEDSESPPPAVPLRVPGWIASFFP